MEIYLDDMKEVIENLKKSNIPKEEKLRIRDVMMEELKKN